MYSTIWIRGIEYSLIGGQFSTIFVLLTADGEYIQIEEGLQRHGYGVHITSQGLSYHGNWTGDKMNGQGVSYNDLFK